MRKYSIKIVLFIVLGCVWMLQDSIVAGQLTTGPNTVVNGVLSVCPGYEISLTCNNSNVGGEFSRWAIDGPLFRCVRVINHYIHNIPTPCGPVTFTNISNTSGSSLTSTAMVTVTKELNGAVAKCFDGQPSSSPQVGNVTINVFDTTATNLSSKQIDTNSTRLFWNISIQAQHCVTHYTVNVTGFSVIEAAFTFQKLSVGGPISDNTPYTYTVTSNPGGYQSGTGNFNIINNRTPPPSPPSLSLSVVNLTSDGMCSLTSVTVDWEAPIADNPITTQPVGNYQLSCILEGSLEDVCSGIRVINGTSYQIPGSNFQQLGNYLFSVRANNTVGLSEDSNISFTVSTTKFTSSAVGSLNDAELTFTTNPSCNSSTFQVILQQCLGEGCTCTDFMYTDPMALNTTNTTLSVSGLVAGNTYCYHANLTVAGTIVGMDDGMFQTLQHVPMAELTLNGGTARLVSTDPSVVYECVNSIEGFNGNSRQIEATFNQTTGVYTVPQCSVLIYAVVLIAIAIILVIVILAVVVIVVVYFVWKKNKKDSLNRPHSGIEDKKQFEERQPPPPEDLRLRADRHNIPHAAAPNSGAEYALIDRSNKNPLAASVDPSSIEHETVHGTGDAYAVIDKPKRKSKKQAGAPDVVPERTEEELSDMYAQPDKRKKPKIEILTYDYVDVAAAGRRKNPSLRPQAQPGSVAPVEYASVDYAM